MQLRYALALVAVCGSLVSGQDREVPKDSSRISVTGCVRGRSLIARARLTPGETVGASVETGRRFRLSGPKRLVEEIRSEKTQMVAVTGLVKRSALSPATQGIPIGAGGRIRIGGGPPNRDPTQVDPRRDPLYNEAVMDVESWRPLPDVCPGRD
jgi:hypothetical protein